MENATKALMIAGAVLLAIMIIALGLSIFTGASDVAKQSTGQISSYEVQTFNEKFSSYAGNAVKGSTVKSLLTTIISSNGAEETNGTEYYVNVATTDTIGTIAAMSGGQIATGAVATANAAISKLSANITAGKSYIVELSGYANDGRVNQITITENSTARSAGN